MNLGPSRKVFLVKLDSKNNNAQLTFVMARREYCARVSFS